MLKLKGSEKQVAWAENIRNNMLEKLNEKEAVVVWLGEQKEREVGNGTWNDKAEEKVATFRNVLEEIEQTIITKEEARWFIDNKNKVNTLTELAGILSVPAKEAYANSPAFDLLDNKIKEYNSIIKAYRRSNNLPMEARRK